MKLRIFIKTLTALCAPKTWVSALVTRLLGVYIEAGFFSPTKSVSILVLMTFVMGLNVTASAQKYVKITATGSANGSSWDNALGASSLKATIEAGGTVYIAAGTYNPTATITLNSATHQIIGGFAATATGTSLSTYNPATNATIISASTMSAGLKRDFYSTSLDIELKGLVLQDGSQGTTGGAVYVGTGKVLKFTDLVIKNNTAGGIGVYSVVGATASVAFNNCIFTNNTNTGNGGALVCSTVYENPDPFAIAPTAGKFTMTNCSFDGNTSSNQGGAIEFTTSHAWEITGTCFSNNTAYLAGGVIFTTSKKNILTNCNFTNNTATTAEGGAMIATTASATLTNCNFVSNTATGIGTGYGGAIFATTASLTMSNTTFYNNTGKAGGAIYSTTWTNNLTSTATNCIFSGNAATSTAGTTTGTNGGGAMVINANANGWDFNGCTFANNTVPTNGWGGAVSHYDAETTFNNTIFYNNTKGDVANISGSDIKNYDNAGHFNTITNCTMQLANAAAYTNQAGGTDATSYGFGAGNTFSNVTNPNVAAAPSIVCPTSVPVICAAGTTAPSVSATTLSNVCPTTTVDLNSLVTSTTPSGARLRWHTVATNPTIADSVATPSVLAIAPTYYAYYFDAVNTCYSPATAAVTVTINVCCTNPAIGGTTTYSGSTVCSTSNIGTIKLSGQTGNVIKWQTSTNGGTVWTDIAATVGKTSYNFVNAANNQKYRAIVGTGSAGCTDDSSSVTTIATAAAACAATTCSYTSSNFSPTIATTSNSSYSSNVILVTPTTGQIAYVTAANNSAFTGVAVGDYVMYVVTYDNTMTPIPTLTAGTNLSALTGCFAVSNPLPTKVCASSTATLAHSVEVSVSNVCLNGISDYTLILRNTGTTTATNVTISDTLAAGLTFLVDTVQLTGAATYSAALSPSSNATGILKWDNFTIPAGDSVIITAIFKVNNAATAGIYHNGLSATAAVGVSILPYIGNAVANTTDDLTVSTTGDCAGGGQPIACGPAFYQVFTQARSAKFATLNVPTLSYTTTGSGPKGMNAIGINEKTGYGYGVINVANTTRFIKIGANNTVFDMGIDLGAPQIIAGDCDTSGNWWSKHDNQFLRINLTTLAQTTFTPTGASSWGADMVFRRKDQKFYSVSGTTLNIYNPATNAVSSLTLTGPVTTNGNGTYGGQWGGSDGDIYISSNVTGKVYRVNCLTGETELIITATSGLSVNDGYYCPDAIQALDRSNCLTFNVQVLLEGPLDSLTGQMSTTLNQRGLLPGQTPTGFFSMATPAGQPYNRAPWHYAGTESLVLYPTDVTDWVLVSLRTDSIVSSKVFQQAALLRKDGTISFVTPCPIVPTGSYYVVVEQRNHMGVMSSAKVLITNHTFTHDFRAAQSYVINNPPSSGQKRLNGRYALYAADGKKDTYVTNFDINYQDNNNWRLETGIFDEYRDSDYNLDADVNFSDNYLWRKNTGRYSGVPH